MYKLYRQKIKGGIAVEEIKVGEYVRTNDGIFKVTKIDGLYIYLDKEYFDNQYQTIRDVTFKERIVNHSFNIIDLIEIGDVVEVVVAEDFEEEYTEKLEVAAVGITDCKGNKLNEVGICGDDEIEYVSLKDIKTILTHEQYERNCYKAKEK
jgi:hypothetical protein|uniref:Uncharacterized protein n=1 Tax=Myoviridae sp. cthRr4 TaxID=2825152 RepID=A0A8S5NVD4_9CAUD|nr:MAG TPA: hypothetical protein [Myoviridae sp. cthRr4]